MINQKYFVEKVKIVELKVKSWYEKTSVTLHPEKKH